jgi:hypothetical protein
VRPLLISLYSGVSALEAHIEDRTFQYLLSFPHLEKDADVQEYYSFCAASTIQKLKGKHIFDINSTANSTAAWWTHKISYPWLLPSLNRELSKMNNNF